MKVFGLCRETKEEEEREEEAGLCAQIGLYVKRVNAIPGKTP